MPNLLQNYMDRTNSNKDFVCFPDFYVFFPIALKQSNIKSSKESTR